MNKYIRYLIVAIGFFGMISNVIIATSLEPLAKLNFSSNRGLPLFVTEEELAHDVSFDIKDFLKEHNIIYPRFIAERIWAKLTNELQARAQERTPPGNREIVPDELPALLAIAKFTAKSFLLTEMEQLPLIKEQSIEKKGLNRLFTYAHMQKVINDKNLSHIRLPCKVLVIRNNYTREYVPSEYAPGIIDDMLKLYMDISNGVVGVRVDYDSLVYELIIFSCKEPVCRPTRDKKLSEEAHNELVELFASTLFDIGYDNIFTDPDNGDAVIIDTEYKGESEEDCVKLDRYPWRRY